MYKKRPKGKFSQTDLALVLHELFDIPIKGYPYEGLKIVNAIKKVITEALQRGEDVEIHGFGRFRVWRPRKTVTMPKPIIYSEGKDRGSKTILSDTPETFPGKNKVFFQPSIQLMAMLNHDNPTNREFKKAIANWKP